MVILCLVDTTKTTLPNQLVDEDFVVLDLLKGLIARSIFLVSAMLSLSPLAFLP